MRNIKLTIEYDGSKYCGWQRQDNKNRSVTQKKQKLSIQEVIELCLNKILRRKVKLIASGRTDSGVHALGQVSNFKTVSKMPVQRIRAALNAHLPKSIRIIEAQEVTLGFHARYWAKAKTYRYWILNQDYKSPFLKDYSYWYKTPLDIRLMNKGGSVLLGKHDFKGFCASGSGIEDTKRKIKRLSISRLSLFSSSIISIEIEADGFLYNMVRNIVGTLIEVGRKRFKPERIKQIIQSKDRSLAGPCVSAKGLYLIKVRY